MPAPEDLLLIRHRADAARRSPNGELFFGDSAALALLEDAKASGLAVTGIETFDWDRDAGSLFVRLDWLMIWHRNDRPFSSWNEYQQYTITEARMLIRDASTASDVRPNAKRVFVLGFCGS